MARPANPNKEKIQALKAEMKEHTSLVRKGETAAKKLEKLQDRLAKLSGDAPVVKKTKKEAAPEKKAKSTKTAKATAKEEKKKTKVVVNKKRGRPKKVADDEDED